MSKNQKYTNQKHDPNTLDLFSGASRKDLHGGDGHNEPAAKVLPEQSLPEQSLPGAPSSESPALGRRPLPALADIELVEPRPLRATRPFRVPGLKGEVLPVPVFSLRLVRERDHLTRMIHTPADVARLCSEVLEGADREVFLVIALSTSNRVIGAHIAHIGTVDASIASPREVFKFALLCNARSLVVCHNHPSGNLEPSAADVRVSKQLKEAGDVVGVRLLDSLVVGHPEDKRPTYTSLAERGLL